MIDPKVRALCLLFDCKPEQLSEEYGNVYRCDQATGEYLVLTDQEADQAWDEALDSYIDECIIPEIKDTTLSRYFDVEAWKRDARHDGRGHSLSTWDGEEIEVRLGAGEYMYVYRVN